MHIAALVALELQPVGAHALLGDDQNLHIVTLQGRTRTVAVCYIIVE
jgi:hypothetical protein